MKKLILILVAMIIAIFSLNSAVINEIMYNPSTALGDDADFEYLEIYIDADIDMSGYTIPGIDYTFPDGASFTSGEYVVLAKNQSNVASHYGITVFGEFTGALGNSGELVSLQDAGGNVIDEVEYDDGGDWPSDPDGGGSSLELISIDLDNSDPANWQASFVLDGTPGAENSTAPNAEEYSIYEIQFTEDEEGGSPLLGTRVSVTGIVTASFDGIFFIQSGTGAWNGIAVDYAADVAVGDEVSLEATVSESYDRTTLANVTNLEVLGQQTVPAAEAILTGDVNLEEYEGVLISVANVTVTNDSLGYGEWEIDDFIDSSGPCVVDDYAAYMYEPNNGDIITGLTGVVEYSFSAFKIEPRGDEDFNFGGEEPELTVISPNGGEQWIQGTTHPITWSSFNLTGMIKIELMGVYDRDRTVLVDETENDGFWEWQIAANQDPSEYYVIYISSVENTDIMDESDATFSILEPVPTFNLVINEIMYNSAGHDNEWIEILNMENETIDLGGYSLMNSDMESSPIILPDGLEIAPQGFVTIQIDHAEQADPFPFTPDFDGSGHWNLMNSEDAVYLYDQYDSLVDEVLFADSGDWDSGADGYGPSLELINPYNDNNVASNWAASTAEAGTPGEQNSVYDTPNNEDSESVKIISLSNYPNPFNPTTKIKLANHFDKPVKLQIFNVLGQEVKTAELSLANNFEYTWHGKDESGKNVASGVYFYSIDSKDVTMQKMLLLK